MFPFSKVVFNPSYRIAKLVDAAFRKQSGCNDILAFNFSLLILYEADHDDDIISSCIIARLSKDFIVGTEKVLI